MKTYTDPLTRTCAHLHLPAPTRFWRGQLGQNHTSQNHQTMQQLQLAKNSFYAAIPFYAKRGASGAIWVNPWALLLRVLQRPCSASRESRLPHTLQRRAIRCALEFRAGTAHHAQNGTSSTSSAAAPTRAFTAPAGANPLAPSKSTGGHTPGRWYA